jgi:predicted nucleic acid-binding protein
VEEIRPLNVLIDVNILLDLFLVREPWVSDARAVWNAHHRGECVGHLAAHALTNLFYIARKVVGIEKAREAVRACLRTFEIVPIGRAELDLADSLPGNDIEDNLVLACARVAQLDAIVTRDPKGYAGSPVSVLAPADLLLRLPPSAPAP